MDTGRHTTPGAGAPRPEHRGLKLAGLVMLGLGLWLIHLFVEPGAQVGAWRPARASAPLRIGLMMLGINGLALAWVLLAAGLGGRQDWRDPRALRAALWRWCAANLLVPVFVLEVLIGSGEPAGSVLGGPVGQTPPSLGAVAGQAAAWVVSIGLFLLILLLGRRSAQHEAATAEEVMQRDPRPPVVYLRSFQDDGQALHAPFDPGGIGRRIAGVVLRTPEQELADVLAHVGPVIAIGKPGERLPELGAARLYVSHEAWQAKVHTLLDAAALVVLRVGRSEGVRWEIEQTLARVPPSRRLFVLLGPPAVLEAGSALLGPLIGQRLAWPPLPRTPGQRVLTTLGLRPQLLGALVGTDRLGVTRLLPLHITLWRPDQALSQLRRRPATLALQRAMSALDTPWARLPPAGPSRGLAVGLALLLGGVGAHWFYLRRPRRAWWHVVLFPLTVSIFLAWWQALAWLLTDRAGFEAAVGRSAAGGPAPPSVPLRR